MLRSWIPQAGRCQESFEQGVVCSVAGSRKTTLGVDGRCWSLGASLGSVDKGCPSNEVLIAYTLECSGSQDPRSSYAHMSVDVDQEMGPSRFLGKKQSLKCNPKTSRTPRALFIFAC